MIDLAAKSIDVNIDDVGGGIETHAPDVIENHGSGDDASGVAAEILEQRKLLAGELQLALAAMSLAAYEIKFEVGDTQAGRFLLRGRAAAKQVAQAGKKFGEREWLGEIVVATLFKSTDTLIDGAAGGKNKYGRLTALRAATGDQLKAIAVGESKIDDESIVDSLQREVFAGSCIGGGIDFVSRLGQSAAKKILNFQIVFNDEQTQALSPSLK